MLGSHEVEGSNPSASSYELRREGGTHYRGEDASQEKSAWGEFGGVQKGVQNAPTGATLPDLDAL